MDQISFPASRVARGGAQGAGGGGDGVPCRKRRPGSLLICDCIKQENTEKKIQYTESNANLYPLEKNVGRAE